MQLTPVNRTILKWEKRLEYCPLVSLFLTLIEQLTVLLIKGDRGSLPLVSPIIRRVNEKPLIRVLIALSPFSFLLYFFDFYAFKKGEELYKKNDLFEAARWGHAESLFRIAKYYPQKVGFDLIVKAADRGSEKAYIAVAVYIIQNNYPLPSEEGYQMLEKLNNGRAYRVLEKYYKNSPQDRLRVLIKGMKLKDPECLFQLANVILRSEGISYNLNLIIKYLTKASQQGHLEATFQLAQMCVVKEYNINDLERALELLFENYKRRHLPSTLLFIRFYLWSRTLFCDYKIVKTMLDWALSQNSPGAYLIAGSCYENGNIYQKDINQAIYHYLKAADSNLESAYYPLGKLYLEQGNKKDALKYLTLAGESNPDGYFLASELEENEDTRKILLQKAAIANHPRALTTLGILGDKESLQKAYVLKDPLAYFINALNMLNSNQDLDTAERLLKLAYEQNIFKAAYYLGNLYRDQNKPELSYEYYKKGASHFENNATFAFAQLLIDGKCSSEDYEEKDFWIVKAQELNPDRQLNFLNDDQETL